MAQVCEVFERQSWMQSRIDWLGDAGDAIKTALAEDGAAVAAVAAVLPEVTDPDVVMDAIVDRLADGDRDERLERALALIGVRAEFVGERQQHDCCDHNTNVYYPSHEWAGGRCIRCGCAELPDDDDVPVVYRLHFGESG